MKNNLQISPCAQTAQARYRLPARIEWRLEELWPQGQKRDPSLSSKMMSLMSYITNPQGK